MKIAYLGNQRHPWCTEVHLARTLSEDLGHEVTFLQEDIVNHEVVLRVALESDLLFWTRTWGLLGIEHVLKSLESASVPTVSYHLDLYWHIARQKDMANDPFWRTKYVFSPDGGSDELFAQACINHTFLWPGVFAGECVDGTPNDQFRKDVGFVGSTVNYHREWQYRQTLVSHLKQRYGNRFGTWPENGPAVRGQDLNDLYATIPVIVGDTLCPNFDHPYYVSDRLFETMGRGGFIIHPRITGLERDTPEGLPTAFKDGEDIVLYDYNDFDGLVDRINFYLDNPDERERIRLAGQNRVKKHHTYTSRLTEALDVIADGEGR